MAACERIPGKKRGAQDKDLNGVRKLINMFSQFVLEGKDGSISPQTGPYYIRVSGAPEKPKQQKLKQSVSSRFQVPCRIRTEINKLIVLFKMYTIGSCNLELLQISGKSRTLLD